MSYFNHDVIAILVDALSSMEAGTSKEQVISRLNDTFSLTRDRSVYDCREFAVRICSSKNGSFSNTVLSLSSLLKYDHKPFIVVLASPKGCELFLANTTFLKRISHSSQEFRVDNIRGSFNGSDIVRQYDGIKNSPENFDTLFAIHQAFTVDENIERLVEATNNISPRKEKFAVTVENRPAILSAPRRAVDFLRSDYYEDLASDLDARSSKVADLIAIAAFIDNVNLRGRVIEELVTSDDPRVIDALSKCLRDGTMLSLNTNQKLGDYHKSYAGYDTETDIKTKVLFLQSAPKAYNIDKLLEFLAEPDSVYLFYLIGINEDNDLITRLVSVFQKDLLAATRIQFHWAGRNTRGVTQLEGHALNSIISNNSNEIDLEEATRYLEELIDL